MHLKCFDIKLYIFLCIFHTLIQICAIGHTILYIKTQKNHIYIQLKDLFLKFDLCDFKSIISRPLFIIIFRPKMVEFTPIPFWPINEGCIVHTPYLSALDFPILQFEISSLMNWIFFPVWNIKFQKPSLEIYFIGLG